MQRENTTYFRAATEGIASMLKGLKITLKHMRKATGKVPLHDITNQDYFRHTDGIATIQYPHESIPVPDNGRYRLHNEIDDCIVCDKCAKICPVNCITIEPIKATEEIGKTSDGTSKRIYAAKFDIDMGKCCFCGLCTTVCPTECLTMTKVYDFSVFDIRDHNFSFADMTAADIEQKKKLLEESQQKKLAQQQTSENITSTEQQKNEAAKPAVAKPVFKPKIKPPSSPS